MGGQLGLSELSVIYQAAMFCFTVKSCEQWQKLAIIKIPNFPICTLSSSPLLSNFGKVWERDCYGCCVYTNSKVPAQFCVTCRAKKKVDWTWQVAWDRIEQREKKLNCALAQSDSEQQYLGPGRKKIYTVYTCTNYTMISWTIVYEFLTF